MGRKLATLLLGVALAAPVSAGQLEGVNMPDTTTVGGATLVLNGMGLRAKKITFLKIKVYVAGLYLPAKSMDPNAIMNTDEPRQLVMEFLYKQVSRDQLVEAWMEGFNANSPDAVDSIKAQIDKFIAMWPAMRSGDRAVLTYVPGAGTTIEIRGENKGTIPGADFASAMFGIWLGANPPSAELKDGLLGNH